jgi:hypothetical protein
MRQIFFHVPKPSLKFCEILIQTRPPLAPTHGEKTFFWHLTVDYLPAEFWAENGVFFQEQIFEHNTTFSGAE